jgi:uncharacterized protein GlcG (DUF336 family)
MTESRGARQLALQPLKLEKPPYDFAAAFQTLAEGDTQMVLVLSSPFFSEHRSEIAEAARARRLPTMFIFRSYVDAGGLISYGVDQVPMYRRIAGYIAKIFNGAKATCKANGYAVSATVVGRNGEIIVQVRGDNTGPHTLENSMRKAYTARTFRSPSGALVERLKADPTLGLIHLTNVIANQGALPIKVGDEVIGAAGASGAPGGEKDEACVKAGIDKVADQLK